MENNTQSNASQKNHGCFVTLLLLIWNLIVLLFKCVLLVILVPLKLLTNKKVLLTLLVIGVIGAGIWGVNTMGDIEFPENVSSDSWKYRYDEGSITLKEKVLEMITAGDFAEAARYVQENEWYRVEDEATVNALITAMEERKFNTRGQSTIVSGTDYKNVEVVLSRLQWDLSVLQQIVVDDFYCNLGILFINSETDYYLECLEVCEEGTYGSCLREALDKILAGEAIAGAKLLDEKLGKNGDLRYATERLYQKYLENVQQTGLADILEYELALAIIEGCDHAAALSTYQAPTYYAAETDPMSEEIRAGLPAELSNCNGDKVLILKRYLVAGTDEVTLDVDSLLMSTMPEKFMPESIDDIGYILLVDYGYINDGIWYAGTATISVYEVATGDVIYTSETLNGEYREFYYGPETDCIFGSYPNLDPILIPALETIP